MPLYQNPTTGQMEVNLFNFLSENSEPFTGVILDIPYDPFGTNGLPRDYKDPGKSVITYRKQTVSELADLILARHVILVKAPPYSGKTCNYNLFVANFLTALCQLVALHLGKKLVVKMTEGISFQPGTDFEEWWNNKVNLVVYGFSLFLRWELTLKNLRNQSTLHYLL
jgi:hypothetical protein